MYTEKLKFWQAELIRISDWIKVADQKAGFVFLLYSAIMGIVINYKHKIINSNHNYIFWILITGFSISIFLGSFCLFLSVFPRLKTKDKIKSYFFYGDIKNMDKTNFINEANKLTNSNKIKQILDQIHITSTISFQKMENVQKSIKFLFFTVIFLIELMINSL